MSSLSDVWGEQDNVVNIISAKAANDENVESITAPQQKVVDEELLKGLQALLLEIHELRREQARRCSVYMIMIGILFGIMILYVDKLNNNITSRRHISHPFP